MSFSLLHGEVHALLGENGAGKTTLMNMCFGLVQPDSGEILVNGKVEQIRSPTMARRLGIGMVHQHFKLVPSLSVVENVFLGVEKIRRSGTLDRKAMARAVVDVAERYGLELRPDDTVADLSAGARQRVEIMKALYFDAQVLILDEPTAVLTPQETVGLFSVMRNLAEQGRSVVVITHKLREVIEVSDRYSVMRRAALVSTGITATATEEEIALLMVGRQVSLGRADVPAPADATTPPALQCAGVTLVSDDAHVVLDDVSFDVRPGEILGIAGVEGNGQSELVETLAGLRIATRGMVTLAGFNVSTASPDERRQLGLGHIPEDRLATGVCAQASVTENLVGGFLRSNVFRRGFYRRRFASRWADEIIARYDIRGATPTTRASALSGGNMQKVVVARELSADPNVLLAAQPTRGIDIGASEFVHGQLRALRDRGSAIVLVSADLGEVLALADRVLVMYRGRIVGEYPPEDDALASIGLAMAGANIEEHGPVTARSSTSTVEGATLRRSLRASSRPRSREITLTGPVTRADRVAYSTTTSPPDAAHAPSPLAETDSIVAGVRAWLAARTSRARAALAQPGFAVMIALLVGFFTIWSTGKNPLSAYRYFLLSSFTSVPNFSAMVAQLEPLLLVGTSVYLSFRGGVFNVGGEGQMYIGAFAGAIVAFTFTGLNGPLLIVLSCLAGALGGALWALVPALLYSAYGVNVVVTTLMLNYVATYLTAYLVAGPFYDSSAGSPESKMIANQAHLPQILGFGGADIGIFIGLGLLIAVASGLSSTRWGLKVRFVGGNPDFARGLGIGVRSTVVELMLLSGAIAGVAGVVETLGTQFRFNQTFSPGYGFLGLTVALLGRLSPVGIVLAAFVYAVIEAGSSVMQLNINTPLALVQLVEGVVVVLMTGSAFRIVRRKS